MKKLYILFILTLTFSISNAQTWRYMNGAGTDIPWNDTSSWSGGNQASDGDYVGIWNQTLSVDLDIDFTGKLFQNDASRTVDLIIGGANTLTIDIAQDANATGILNHSSATTNLTFDGAVDIFNSTTTPGPWRNTDINITGDANNKITFGENSVLNLGGLANQSIKLNADNATQTYEFNGDITGDKILTIGVNVTANFNSTSDNSGWAGNLNVWEGANVTVNSAEGIKFSNKKLTAAGNGATVTLNNANVMGGEVVVNGTNVFDLNVNANQSLSVITMSGAATFNLNLDGGVTELNFWRNHNKVWGTSTLNINGYKEGVINFGNANPTAGLTAQQLSQITINGAVPDGGDPLSLDATGHLIGASNLVLGVKDHKAFDFAVYPNPVKDLLHINTQEALEKIEVADLLGRTVFKQNNVSKSVDISSLNKGVYILKLTSEKGISTKKIIKE